MTISAAQVREACALLRWKAPRLCKGAKVSYKAALNARRDEGISTLSDADLQAILKALETAGVIFIETNGEGPGVRLRKAEKEAEG